MGVRCMIGYYNYTVILTYLGLTSSIIGIYYSMEYHPFIGILCLLFSGLCDTQSQGVENRGDRSGERQYRSLAYTRTLEWNAL